MGELIGVVVILVIMWIGLSDFFRSGRTARDGKVGLPPDVSRSPAAKAVSPASPAQPPQPAFVLSDLPPDVARMVAGLPERSLDELQKQWLNTIALIDRVGQEKAAPYIVFRSALSAEWARRLAIAEADPRAFPWPSTKAPKGKSGIDSGDWHLIGMLSYLGYRVGSTNGVSAGIRRQILDLCFASALPPINGLSYMRDWGLPGTPLRLRKLAHELASFARNGKRKRSANLEQAVADWEADLGYLYRQYYVRKFRFAWPRID